MNPRAENLHRTYSKYYRMNLLMFLIFFLILSIFDGTNIQGINIYRKTFI